MQEAGKRGLRKPIRLPTKGISEQNICVTSIICSFIDRIDKHIRVTLLTGFLYPAYRYSGL